MHRIVIRCALAVMLACAAPVVAQETESETRAVTLQLAPAALPTPALTYQLLPTLPELRPEHAEFVYARLLATAATRSPTEDKDRERVTELLEAPLAEFSAKEAEELLGRLPLHEGFLESATRCRDCRWDLPYDERPTFLILLPELQPLRNEGRMLALKAKMQIANGDAEGALKSLTTGCALARQMAQGPTLIHGLVGISVMSLMGDRIAELATLPNAPNLYWAITALPQPFLDSQRWLGCEMYMLDMSYPEWSEARATDHTEKFWDEFFARMHHDLGMMGENLPGDLKLEMILANSYPAAKKHLLATGMSAETVERIGVSQAVTILTIDNYLRHRDDVFKWAYLPASEAMPKLSEAIEKLGRPTSDQGLPLAQITMPALNHGFHAILRQERQLALLRVIEALRFHAAEHDGKLPTTLAEITAVPVPEDPWTRSPFDYEVQGETAILKKAPPAGQPAQHGIEYRLTVRKAK